MFDLNAMAATITSKSFQQQQDKEEKKQGEFINEYNKLIDEFSRAMKIAREQKDFITVCKLMEQQTLAEKELHEKFFH